MAPFKLHTSPLSYNSLRPELVIAEKGITDFETVPVDIITGSHKVRQVSGSWRAFVSLDIPSYYTTC